MSLLLELALILGSSFVLVKSVKLFIRSTSNIAQYFGISDYTIGFLLVAIATSLPEMVVGITSAVQQKTILSFGDAMGSNIALITVVVAAPGLINSGISTRQVVRSKDIYYTALFSLLALALSFDGKVSRVDGMFLLLGYFIYSLLFLRRRTSFKKLITKLESINIWKEIVLFCISLVFLLLASEGIVGAALNISEVWGLQLSYIGMSITALGTSLPEIAFVIGEAREHNDDEIMGDVVGSVVANSTLVLGTASIIYPVFTNGRLISVSLGFTLALAISIFLLFSKSKERIDRGESAVLFLLYFLFIIGEYFIQGLH
jgi:cation:H+ antiporter